LSEETRESNILYFNKLLEESCALLVKIITDHRSKVPSSSMTNPFYVHFSTEQVDERTFYSLCLLLGGYIRSLSHYPPDSVEEYLVSELHREVEKISKRFKETKFFKFFYYILNTPLPLNLVIRIPSEREYDNNYIFPLDSIIGKVFSVRFLTPRRVKRAEFRRGYRDHGSMSDKSTRARRQANTRTVEDSYTLRWDYEKPEPLPLKVILSEIEPSDLKEFRLTGTVPSKKQKDEYDELRKKLKRRRKEIRQKFSGEDIQFY
jgi:hypothetical protein